MRKTAVAIALTMVVLVFVGVGGPQPAFAASPSSFRAALTAPPPINGPAIVKLALTCVGARYVDNGISPTTGFDDTGFIRYVYASQGIALPSNLRVMRRQGIHVTKADLEPGDLLFFQNTVAPGLSHVGIYVGNGTFVHAEWYGYGVTVSSLTNDARDGNYWATHYRTAVRL
jgi:cell wall-associated NlpC family hydrolase